MCVCVCFAEPITASCLTFFTFCGVLYRPFFSFLQPMLYFSSFVSFFFSE